MFLLQTHLNASEHGAYINNNATAIVTGGKLGRIVIGGVVRARLVRVGRVSALTGPLCLYYHSPQRRPCRPRLEQRLLEDERNPLLSTTFGSGELIADALKHGGRRIISGLGGSATNEAVP